MRKLRTATIAAVAACTVGASAAHAAPQPSANGSGDVATFEDFNFSARGTGFGASGSVHEVQSNTDPNTQFKGRVNCLFVFGNRATLSGNITSITPAQNPATAPTDFFAFAEDNGEPGEFRDRWLFFTFTPTPTFNPTCLAPTFTPFGNLITAGNIDVDPVP